MFERTTRPRLRRNLRLSIVDGGCYSTMVGIGETYLSAFVLAVAGNQVASGLVTTIPQLAGALLQMVSPRAVGLLNSHRRWVITCVVGQALSFVPLTIAAITGNIPIVIIFALASLYWAGGMAAGSAWNTWMGRVIAPTLRANFFAIRTRVMQASTLAGVLAGGFILEYGAKRGHPVTTYAILFVAACIMRLISSRMLTSMTEPAVSGEHHRVMPIREVMSHFLSRDGRLLVYILAVQFGQQIAAPYFNPFLLQESAFSYWQYTLLLSAAYIGRSAAAPAWGRFARRLGTQPLLAVGGLGIIPLAGLWLVSSSFWYLLALQFIAGAFWSAFDLATMLLYLETIDADERTSVLTGMNLFNALAFVAGSILGGGLLHALDGGRQAYVAVFCVSTAVRLSTIFLLVRLPRYKLSPVPIASDTMAVRPSAGSIDRADLASLPDVIGGGDGEKRA